VCVCFYMFACEYDRELESSFHSLLCLFCRFLSFLVFVVHTLCSCPWATSIFITSWLVSMGHAHRRSRYVHLVAASCGCNCCKFAAAAASTFSLSCCSLWLVFHLYLIILLLLSAFNIRCWLFRLPCFLIFHLWFGFKSAFIRCVVVGSIDTLILYIL